MGTCGVGVAVQIPGFPGKDVYSRLDSGHVECPTGIVRPRVPGDHTPLTEIGPRS